MFLDILKYILSEAKYKELMDKQSSITKLFPTFYERVKAVAAKGGVKMEDQDNRAWYFKVHSGTKDNVWYDDVIEFKDIENVVGELAKDRMLWKKNSNEIDYNKLSQVVLQQCELRLGCSCPAQLYFGGDYVLSLSRYDAKAGDKETRPPNIRNPRQYGAFCKHLGAVMKVYLFHGNTLAKWLREYHGKAIAKIGKEANKEAEKFKAAGKALGKRKDATDKRNSEPTDKTAEPAKKDK